jgi:hypothetical protein
MLRFPLIFLFVLISAACPGQKTITVAENDSTLIIVKDQRLDGLTARQKQENLEKQSMPGYRVQIYFGSSRQKASEIKLEFGVRYPDIPAYLTYQQPNYKVRVGDYRSRFEARKFLSEIEGKYPTTFVVPDDVRLPPLR